MTDEEYTQQRYGISLDEANHRLNTAPRVKALDEAMAKAESEYSQTHDFGAYKAACRKAISDYDAAPDGLPGPLI